MKKIKEYKGVIIFYLLIILCVFVVSNQNGAMKPADNIKKVRINNVALNK